MSIHPDPEMDKAMRRWRERAEVAEAAHQASEEERIQAEKVANALATDLDNWKRDFSFQHQRADKAEAELTRLREELNKREIYSNGTPEAHRQLVENLRLAIDQRDTLLAALSRYGRHDVECKRWEVGTTRLDDRTCTCGYDAAISEVEDSTKGGPSAQGR